jgi:hypothetical protein
MLRKAGCCKTKEVATGNGAAVRVSTAKVPVSAMAGQPALVFRVLSEKRLAHMALNAPGRTAPFAPN